MKKFFTLSVMLFLGHSLFAQFTAGNIVVSRVGDGTSGFGTGSSAATKPVTLLEFNPSAFISPTPLIPTYELSIPSIGATNTRITASAVTGGGTDGTITLSQDGRYIVSGGMDTDPIPVGNAAPIPNKNLYRVNKDGTIEFSQTFTNFDPGFLRGYASVDGQSIYVAGSSNWISLATFGNSSLSKIGANNYRGVYISQGQLYIVTATSLNSYALSLPTASNTLTILNGTNGAANQDNANGATPTNNYTMVMLDTDPTINNSLNGGDVIYMNDLTTTNGQRIIKLAYNTATDKWDKVGTIATGSSTTTAVMGVTAKYFPAVGPTPAYVQLYAIRGTGSNNELIAIKDDAGRTNPLPSPTVDVLAAAGTNYTFRNIVFAPTSGESVAPSAPTGATATQASATSMTVSWTGITKPDDFANYTVVRYAATPDGTDNPAQKTNYNVGTTIPGANTGVIAYTGPLTTFTDAGLTTGTTYTYRVYAFDNSFNYSTAAETGATTLPIKLLSFSGKAIQNGALLSWSTASEQNNQKFEVSGSTDGLNYTFLGSVAGAGNFTTQKNYSFLDKNPAKGRNYYKLKQVDFDGNFQEFVAVVNYDLDEKPALTVYPNPVTDQVSVSLTSSAKARSINIYDVNGKVVLKSAVQVGSSAITLDVSMLKPGQYIIKVTGNGEMQVTKFIK